MGRPWVDASRQRLEAGRNRCLIEHGRDDGESIAELVSPRLAQPRGTQDQRAIDEAARPELGQDQAGLNRLAEADAVGQQYSRGAAQNGEGRLQLIGEQVEIGAGGGP